MTSQVTDAGRNLNAKQARFCEEYVVDLNATQAAIRAGYSRETARFQASDLLTKPNVVAYVEELQSDRSEETGITAAWVLKRLAEEAFADVADLYDDEGMLKPVDEWPMVWRTGLVAGIEVETKYERKDGDVIDVGRVAKIKLADRAKRLELIGRHIGVQAFKENIGLTGVVGIAQIPADALSDDALRALAGIALDKS